MWFSILERRVLCYGEFDGTTDLAWQVHHFFRDQPAEAAIPTPDIGDLKRDHENLTDWAD